MEDKKDLDKKTINEGSLWNRLGSGIFLISFLVYLLLFAS